MECNTFNKKLPAGRPLELVDARGVALFVGDKVHLLSVDFCAEGLPQEDQDELFSFVGTIKTIMEVDDGGFIWFAFHERARSAGFCLKPTEVALETPAQVGMKMKWTSIFGKKEAVRKIDKS